MPGCKLREMLGGDFRGMRDLLKGSMILGQGPVMPGGA
jgi:hypothetical protein